MIKHDRGRIHTDTESTSNLEDKIEKLKLEIEELEIREAMELDNKKRILTSVLQAKNELTHYVNKTELQIKEKEQEEKLSDLK